LCCCEEKIKGDALINFAILKSMPIKIISQISDEELPSLDLIVDAILGTGFTGEVRPPLCDTITRINRSGKPVLAVDVPSGLDCSTGKPSETTIRAKVTVSFVAVKDVYLRQELKEYLGNVYVGDIGVPRELISRVELLG
jgi:NAD(P)H-hydrate epimerase